MVMVAAAYGCPMPLERCDPYDVVQNVQKLVHGSGSFERRLDCRWSSSSNEYNFRVG